MSSSSNTAIVISFFGATGGCANACLAHTLNAGYKASALARTPAKLTTQLLAQGLDQATIDRNLTIIQGDATNVEDVKRTLCPESNNGTLVSTIISGVGGAPKLRLSLLHPFTLDNPEICTRAAETLISAVRELQVSKPQSQPLVAMISTTGISSGPEDVPFLLRFLYHHLLAIPHVDKRQMERAVISAMDTEDASARPFRGFVILRPTLLTGDQSIKSGKGWQSLKVGTEKEPALGYTVQRADVGEWIFQEVIKNDGGNWINEMVSLAG
jgi:hypothetical protein